MTDYNDRAEKRTDTDEESITDLGDLEVGDKVLFGDRKQPLTVTDTATKRHYSPALDEEITPPVAHVQGDWKDAKPFALAHRVNRITENDGQYDPALEQTEAIVAVVGQKAARGTWGGKTVEVVRVERAGPECELEGSDTEVVA